MGVRNLYDPASGEMRSFISKTLTIRADLWRLFAMERERLGCTPSELFCQLLTERYAEML